MVRKTGKLFVGCFIFLSLLFSLCSNSLNGVMTQYEMFLRGNLLYEKDDMDGAIEAYQGMKSKGPAVLLNVGNCFFNKKDYVKALVYWHRAKKSGARQICGAVRKNILVLNKKLGKDSNLGFYAVAWSKIDYLVSLWPLIFWQLLFLALFLFLSFLMFFYSKKYHFLIFLLVLMCVAIGGLLYRKNYLLTCEFGIIKKEHVDVLSLPGVGAHRREKIDYAVLVTIEDRKEDWYKIKSGSTLGWCESSSVEVV